LTGIALPAEDRLPPGPHRALLEALHGLYEGAGKPGLRRIAAAITNGEYRDTISHEKVGALLRGDGLPGWLKVECVVRQLAAWHNPRLDPDEEAARFTVLWLAADRARRPGESPPAAAAPDSAAPPALAGETGLPSVVRGRDGIIHRLSRGLDPRHCPGRPQVLAGVAGIGKSTIAASVADVARREGARRRAWWVCAADEEQLSRDLAGLACDLGVGEADWARLRTRAVAGLSDVADRVWEMLEREPAGWLLVVDNADDPGLLGPQDGMGWIRGTECGLLLITTRDSDAASWPGADLIRVGPLPPEAAAQVLTDLAPAAGDRTAARALARQLGCVPMELRLAGMYLRQDSSDGPTFDEYRRAQEHAGTPDLLLDGLVRAGFPQARPLLWLLACYAPSSLIPEEIITGGVTPAWSPPRPAAGLHPLARLLDPGQALPALAEYCCAGLQELQSAGLIDRSKSDDGRAVIQVHALIAEDARAVMDGGTDPAAGPDPALVRASAAAAACAFAAALDTGSAEHWPYFRVLTPHVEELLLHTAARLGARARRDLLACMVLCISAHIWSKAEQRAEQLALKAMNIAADLGCDDQDVQLRLRHVHAWARQEQGWLTEAAGAFQDILARQLQMKNAATRLDTLRTRQQLAWTLGRQGRWADAETGLREVIRLLDERQRQHGAEGYDARILRLHTRCKINWCVGQQSRWAEAEYGYRQLVTDREEVLGPEHPDTLDARFDIGKALAWQGKWTAAENEWRHNTSDRAQALGEHHPDTLLSRQLMLYAGGYQAWQSGDGRARRIAVGGLEAVLSIQREKRGDGHRETIETRALLAALRGDYSPGMMWPEDLPRPGTD
jgi:hypothetical protein